jgi:hypothetical protein
MLFIVVAHLHEESWDITHIKGGKLLDLLSGYKVTKGSNNDDDDDDDDVDNKNKVLVIPNVNYDFRIWRFHAGERASVPCDVMPRSHVEVHGYFQGIFRLHLQGQGVNQISRKKEADSREITWSYIPENSLFVIYYFFLLFLLI